MALCGETGEPARRRPGQPYPTSIFTAPCRPAGSFVALCGGTRPETRESGRIRGLVRKNATPQAFEQLLVCVGFGEVGLSPVRLYDSPVTLAAFLAHSVPLVLIAAVSPVLFLNASRVVEAAGIFAGLFFAGGAVLCLVALGIPTMGLMGAATSQRVAADLASRGVDLVLALVLIAYGAWQFVRSRRHRTSSATSHESKDDALPTGGRALFAAGLLGMLTNFTSLPLYLSVAQRTGTVAVPWWARALLLILVIVVVAIPVWLPVVLRAVAPARSGIKPETRRKIQKATQWISIGACFVGGAVIIWHVLRV